MMDLSKQEKRMLARVSGIKMSRLRKWTLPVGILFIGLGAAEIILAYARPDYPFDFWRMLCFVYCGGSLIDTTRLYGLIQKLAGPQDSTIN